MKPPGWFSVILTLAIIAGMVAFLYIIGDPVE